MNRTSVPVVFIHGLWLHGSSWQPWVELFREAGYQPVAPGWPGDADTVEECRAHPDSLAGHGIDDVTEHYAKIIGSMPERPILIGHSFGGMIAEKLLGEDHGVAAIGIDAAQIKGVLPLPLSSLRSTLPVFKNPANNHKAVSLTAKEFHYSFGAGVTTATSFVPPLLPAGMMPPLTPYWLFFPLRATIRVWGGDGQQAASARPCGTVWQSGRVTSRSR